MRILGLPSHAHFTMERTLLSVDGVSIALSTAEQSMGDACRVELHTTQLDLVSGTNRVSLPFSVIKAINLHQPIFGANYIAGEYMRDGRLCTFTLTFKRGGATDFTRLFFRLARGELQHDQTQTDSSSEARQETTTDDKKNR